MNEPVKFTDFVSTFNAGDIAFIKSILEAEGIPYHIEGENFLQVRPLVEPAHIQVDESRLEEARELIRDFKPGNFGYKAH